jgi:predicted PurR-regulated permease PerM
MNPKRAAKRRSFSLIVLAVAALYVFIHTFSLLSPILLSFLLILLISVALNPVIFRLRTWTGGRRGAAGLAAASLVVVIALTGWAFLGPMKDSVSRLTERLPGYWERLQKPLIKMEQRAELSEERLQAEVTTEIAEGSPPADKPKGSRPAPKSAPEKTVNESSWIRSGLIQMFQAGASSFTAVAFNAAQIGVVLVTVFFGVTFTLMDPRPIVGSIFSLVPERHHAQTLTIVRRIGKFLPGWAGATMLGMLTIGVLVFLLMWPIFGPVDALVLGLIAGVFEAVPFVGPLLSAVPALLFALGKGGNTPLWVLAAYLAIQALENNVILPLIMAREMKLHPLAVIFSMLLCVAAFGVLGVVVAAPLVAIVDILHDELYRKRLLPTVTDADLDRLARQALHENVSAANRGGVA